MSDIRVHYRWAIPCVKNKKADYISVLIFGNNGVS
jgi:hypothetical protein